MAAKSHMKRSSSAWLQKQQQVQSAVTRASHEQATPQQQSKPKHLQQNTHLVSNTPASGGRVDNLHHSTPPSQSLRPSPLHPDPTHATQPEHLHATQRTHPRARPNQPHNQSNGPSPLLAKVQHNNSTKQRASYRQATTTTTPTTILQAGNKTHTLSTTLWRAARA